jgi:DNA modification methylase
MNIIYKKTSELIPYINNPRKNDNAVDKVASSIKNFGFKVPIILDSKNEIITGHTRLKAAIKLNMDTVPCLIADDLTDAQIKAFRIADNKVAEFSEWDMDLLNVEFEELKEFDFDMEQFGFEDTKENIEVVEDDFDVDGELQNIVEPITKRGDIWRLGRHRLLCGDSTVVTDVERLMDGNKADMLLTDPPYGVSYSGKNEFLNSIDKGNRNQKPIENDNKKPEEMYDFWKSCFLNAYIVTKEKMSYYISAPQGGDLLLLLQSCRDSGFALKHQIIWNKNNHVLGRCDYNYKHEPIIFGWKITGTHEFFGKGKCKTSVWDFNKPHKNDLHPTMKPIELWSEAILNSSNDNYIILDLFAGSGTIFVSCEQTNRIAYGMEYDEKYCDIIIKRWETLTGNKAELIKG